MKNAAAILVVIDATGSCRYDTTSVANSDDKFDIKISLQFFPRD